MKKEKYWMYEIGPIPTDFNFYNNLIQKIEFYFFLLFFKIAI